MKHQPDLINLAIAGELDELELIAFRKSLIADPTLRAEYLEMLATDHLLAGQFGSGSNVSLPAETGFRRIVPMRSFQSFAVLALVASFAILLVAVWILREEKTAPLSISNLSDTSTQPEWMPGATRNFSNASSVITLSPEASATFNASTSARLREKNEGIDLLSGIGHFKVRSAPDSPSFQVHAAGRIVRDIGTDFSVITDGRSYGEVHVSTGSVSISTPDGSQTEIVHAGGAARWFGNLPVSSIPISNDPSALTVPITTTFLEDDFNKPDGTSPDGMVPKIGSEWLFVPATASHSVNLRNGSFDSTGGPCSLGAAFSSMSLSANKNSVFFAELELLAPAGQPEPDIHPDGETKILFHDEQGRPALIIEALFENSNLWRLTDPQSGETSSLSSLKASEQGRMEMSYDYATGKTTLLASSGNNPPPVSILLPPELDLERITIENRAGGDIAIDSIILRAIRFSEKNPSLD